MKHKWLVIKNYQTFQASVEFIYLTNLLIKHFFNSLIFNFYFFNKSTTYCTLNRFLFNLAISNYPEKDAKAHRPFIFYESPLKNNKFSININANIPKKFYFQNNSTINNFFNALSLFNFFFNKNFFSPHHNFDYYILKSSKNNLIIVKFQKFYKRWADSLNFLFNLYFYDLKPLVFGNLYFKKEILAINWNYKIFDFFLWRFYYSFFIEKRIQFDNLSNYFFTQVKTFNIRFFFITDVFNHYKNFYFFKKNYFFTIGVINIFTNPWMTDYPFFLFSDNYISQLFFFKLLIFFYKKSLHLKYSFYVNKLLNLKFKI